MKKIIVNIITYDRPYLLYNLLYSLDYQICEDFYFEIRIYDDCSTLEYPTYNPKNYKMILIKSDFHYGWYKLIGKIFEDMKTLEFCYMIFISDYLHINPLTISESIRLYESINDVKKISLTFTNDKNISWTNFYQSEYNDEINLCQWIETTGFICDRRLLEFFNYRLQNLNENHHFSISEIDRFLTLELFKADYNMYIPKNSIAFYDTIHKSTMNNVIQNNCKNYYNSRFYKSIINTTNNSYIVASLCSIPSRVESLKDTVKSILPNVDRLHVFLNNYDFVPDFLNDNKIIVARSQDYGDYGASNKFFWSDKIYNCYHFVCDDDLIYTQEYFKIMKNAIDKSQRKNIYSFLGAILFDKEKFTDYYKSKISFHMRTKRLEEIPVHICGTGVLAYHTSSIIVSINDFKYKNMADIWFGVIGQKQKVPFRLIGYEGPMEKYMIISSKYNKRDTIYFHSYRLNDNHEMNTREMQNKVIMENFPWILY